MTATFFNRLGAVVILCWLAVGLAACASFAKGDNNRHNIPLNSGVVQGLRNMGSAPERGMVVRIFKQESVLEVWKQTGSGTYNLFKTYEICTYSGDLGPKFKEGDRQSPEGFYTITPGLMNPKSAYYLSFNTGFPNKFDRVNGRSGSNLMVHGDCKSVGCYAMTDAGIAEIYALARETFKGGNTSFQLQIFPFRMTPANLAQHASSQHIEFWKDIKEGYDYFETTKTPPVWDVCEKQYIFNPSSAGPLDPAGLCPPSIQNASVTARQQADDAALASRVATIQNAAAKQEAEKLALQQREQAIGGFFNNMGNMFNGGAAPVPATAPAPAPAMSQPSAMPTASAQRP